MCLDNIEIAARQILAGGIVAFPTETVYGLGADGLNPNAVEALFELKRRPLSDPVILHVADTDQALKLVDLGERETCAFKILCNKFWPGPLSLVVKKATCVPDIITASTGFVAIRSPRNQTTLELIRRCGRPIAGPSANPFKRISPTSADHVKYYFSDQGVLVLESRDSSSEMPCCDAGIESTVAKLEFDESSNTLSIRVLRQGVITAVEIESALISGSLGCTICVTKVASNGDMKQSPGWMKQHYSPLVPTYLLVPSLVVSEPSTVLSKSILLDLMGDLGMFSTTFAGYVFREDFRNDSASLASCLYKKLFEAEQLAISRKCDSILIWAGDKFEHPLKDNDSEILEAVMTRLIKSCSGKCVNFHISESGSIEISSSTYEK